MGQTNEFIGADWKWYHQLLLRTFIIYAVITVIPLAPSFYSQDFDAGFSVANYPWRWLDVVSQNNPWFFGSQGGKNYSGWFVTLFICFIAGAAWLLIEKQISKNKNALESSTGDGRFYNWFFILVRYQVALRMSWFAIAKVFPVQMPFPTISQLNTNLGDFTPGKLYWLTTGVSPFFEVFAGIFELVATILILFRRTATLGALMMIAILLPIWFVNIGYDAGVELASLHLLLLSLLLLAKDATKFWQLLIEHKAAAISYIRPPVFSRQWKKVGRIVLKVGFIFIFLVYRGYHYGKLYAAGKTFKLPLDSGVASFTGFYNVAEFKINNQVIPYAPYDSLRWQNVVFEKFNTISIKVAKPFKLNTQNKIRTTEYYGNIGRLFYGYDADTVKHVFTLKNRADTSKKVLLTYTIPKPGSFILKGLNERKDSVYIVLNRIDKQYPLAVKRNTKVAGD
ncbi:hypothetical protein [Mucilaginibacter sp. FT3.2]|uniref:hypothetical protein n=1 Tax=Mucilaginibacter sp. FT3.2 TaxID=2723090 RepID=UPI001606F50D|nr:hypothetical protein [Mucilaginibacter sp. FT3.2]MBB6231648.1 putative membrane protein YphA (DoxX/SURF4 family) [Mucilaginibacter sp. FT3.2]